MFPLVGLVLYFMFNAAATASASNSVYNSRKFFEKYKKYCKVKMPSHCDHSISLEKVIKKEKLETEHIKLEPELSVCHEDKGKDKGKKSTRTKAADRIARAAVVFECVYCGHLMDRLYYLRFHVIGRRQRIHDRCFRRIDCRKRLQIDGLSYDKKIIPVSCPPPKIKVWANIICQDPRLIDEEGYFPIPVEIASEWEKFYSRYMI